MADHSHPYKVSVSIITYNQAEFIEKAIEGALKQQVDFPYEIIIGDDYSTDGTRDILLDYKQRYPDLIKLNLQDEHDEEGIAGRKNNLTNLRSARGKYIAFCDGDDYWISEDKLQKQADFMDANSNYAFCFHDAWFIYEGMKRRKYSEQYYDLKSSSTFAIHDIAQKKFHIPSASVFMRRKYISELPGWFRQVYRADHALQLIAAEHGKIKYFKGLLAGYNVHSEGVSQLFSEVKTGLEIYESDVELFRKHINIPPDTFLNPESEYGIELASKAFSQKRWFGMLKYLARSIRSDYRSLMFVWKLFLARITR